MEEKGPEAAVDAAEQKVREYPNCGKLIHMMASMVQGLMMMSGGWSTDREKYEEKIYSWYERVTECSGDEQVKNAAAYMLASEYIKKKEYEKARKMIDSLPKQQADKRILNARLLLAQEKHDEAAVLICLRQSVSDFRISERSGISVDISQKCTNDSQFVVF